MKKLIFLLLVISASALTAQNYQYFTAKQGIPKALEIAKAYFQSDSVDLYEIMCVRTKYFDIDEDYDPYNDSTGKSLFWYYKICKNADSCLFIRIKNNNEFITDTMWGLTLWITEVPIPIDSILIDSDSLVKCYAKCEFEFHPRLLFFKLKKEYSDFEKEYCRFESSLVWYHIMYDIQRLIVYNYYISSLNGKCCDLPVDVPEKNITNSSFNIKSDLNTDNITIELNSDLFQDAELRLYDQVGVLLFANKINNKSYELSTYNYPSGLYLLQIKYSGNVITKTVLVVH